MFILSGSPTICIPIETSKVAFAFANTAFAFAGFSNRAASSHTSCKAKQSIVLEDAYTIPFHASFFSCCDLTWNLTKFYQTYSYQFRFLFSVIVSVLISETLPSRSISIKQMLSFGSSLLGQCLHPWAISCRADCTCHMVIAPKWWDNEDVIVAKMLPLVIRMYIIVVCINSIDNYFQVSGVYTMYNHCTVL